MVKRGSIPTAKFKEEDIKTTHAFCPVCGFLKVKNGKIIHPALDKVMADGLKNGTRLHYVN